MEILRCAQRFLLCGRPLDVTDPSAPLDGETNFILVKRQNVFQSAKEEFQSVSVDTNPGVTLEVGKVYGEGAVDHLPEIKKTVVRYINHKFHEK